jgi:hypothetical protein
VILEELGANTLRDGAGELNACWFMMWATKDREQPDWPGAGVAVRGK